MNWGDGWEYEQFDQSKGVGKGSSDVFSGVPGCKGVGKGKKGFEQSKGVGKGKKPKPGDWYCPNCGDLNFARNVDCRRCATPKPEGLAMAGLKPGDWSCPNCGDLNFAKNIECRKCGHPNPDPAGSQAAMEAGMAAAAARFPEKPGDWYCPSCGHMNFARNLECRKCGTPTPDPEAARAAAESQKSKQEMKPGDWHCSSCGFLNFAKNAACKQCGSPNFQAMYMQMIGAVSGSLAQASGSSDSGKGMQAEQQQQQQQLLQQQQQQQSQEQLLQQQKQQLDAMNAMAAAGGGDWSSFLKDWNAMAGITGPSAMTGESGQYRSTPY